MSNALAIAAVTATLRNLLQNVDQGTGLNGTSVTTKPPDKARDGSGNQLNLFLYQVLPNAAWRNMDIPQQVKPGETGKPPLALNLYYMLTAYGDNDDDGLGHRLLGHAMGILYDYPLLGPQEIQSALPADVDSDLQNQVERVRITLQPLSVEEIFRLWTGFQTQYRISVAYEVSVVLIESLLPVKTPLPVLTRGKDDRGITAQGSTIPPFTTLVSLEPPNKQPAIRPGETLTLDGFHLDAQNAQVSLTSTRYGVTWPLAPDEGTTAKKMTLTLPAAPPPLPDPNAPVDWPLGFYTVALRFTNEDGFTATSNELPLALAPTISNISATNITKDGQGNITGATVQLHCSPGVLQGQRVALLIGDREVPFVFPPQAPQPPSPGIQDLSFDIGVIDAGDYFVRLRFDGVESLLIINRDQQGLPPVFDQQQKVTIQ